MNLIKLSLRSADNPRIIKSDNGTATFASVFAIHNSMRKGKSESIPITVKASRDLAPALVNSLTKGTAFVVDGKLSYYKHPDTSRELYSIWAENLSEITAPKSQAQPSETTNE
jgi:Single-strand binding protein family.